VYKSTKDRSIIQLNESKNTYIKLTLSYAELFLLSNDIIVILMMPKNLTDDEEKKSFD
jgi:hypothetical protein